MTGPAGCTRWLGDEGRYCQSADGLRQFVNDWLCREHQPDVPPPGPGWPRDRRKEGK